MGIQLDLTHKIGNPKTIQHDWTGFDKDSASSINVYHHWEKQKQQRIPSIYIYIYSFSVYFHTQTRLHVEDSTDQQCFTMVKSPAPRGAWNGNPECILADKPILHPENSWSKASLKRHDSIWFPLLSIIPVRSLFVHHCAAINAWNLILSLLRSFNGYNVTCTILTVHSLSETFACLETVGSLSEPCSFTFRVFVVARIALSLSDSFSCSETALSLSDSEPFSCQETVLTLF